MDLLVETQPEVLPMTVPSASTAFSTLRDGKTKNINLNMQGVLDWGSFMDILDGKEREVLAESQRTSDGAPMAMTPATIGAGKGGKWMHEGQAEASGSSLVVATPNKAKLPESAGAQPKTTVHYTFASQDI